MEKWKFLTLPGLEPRPLSRTARSQSLYRLRYPGSPTITDPLAQSYGDPPHSNWPQKGMWYDTRNMAQYLLMAGNISPSSKLNAVPESETLALMHSFYNNLYFPQRNCTNCSVSMSKISPEDLFWIIYALKERNANIYLFLWFVRLLALRPLLAYCASIGW
jgi:hypothetical protein